MLAIVAAWYAMMAVHEFGHVLHAWLSGGTVRHVAFPVLGFSRTDADPNPRPLFVAWGGVIWGVLLPALAWLVFEWRRWALRRASRFFAGFCLVANGAYLAGGAIYPVGDAETLVQLGTPRGALAISGTAFLVAGLLLWHRTPSRSRDPNSPPTQRPARSRR